MVYKNSPINLGKILIKNFIDVINLNILCHNELLRVLCIIDMFKLYQHTYKDNNNIISIFFYKNSQISIFTEILHRSNAIEVT